MNQLISKYQLNNYISLLGNRANIMDYMHHFDLGIGGCAFNGISQEFTVCNKPQLLINTVENKNTVWKDKKNCLISEPDDINHLADKVCWAKNNPEKMMRIAQQANIDTSEYFLESKKGGDLYLSAFQKILNNRNHLE